VDRFTLKQVVLTLRRQLLEKGYRMDGALLFGSHANNTANEHSDIDLAILSCDFEEGAMINAMLYYLLPMAEAVPISTFDYLDPTNFSPLLHEIKTKGLIIL
jgi:predicted nucleotidyltransferase